MGKRKPKKATSSRTARPSGYRRKTKGATGTTGPSAQGTQKPAALPQGAETAPEANSSHATLPETVPESGILITPLEYSNGDRIRIVVRSGEGEPHEFDIDARALAEVSCAALRTLRDWPNTTGWNDGTIIASEPYRRSDGYRGGLSEEEIARRIDLKASRRWVLQSALAALNEEGLVEEYDVPTPYYEHGPELQRIMARCRERPDDDAVAEDLSNVRVIPIFRLTQEGIEAADSTESDLAYPYPRDLQALDGTARTIGEYICEHPGCAEKDIEAHFREKRGREFSVGYVRRVISTKLQKIGFHGGKGRGYRPPDGWAPPSEKRLRLLGRASPDRTA